MFNRNQSGKSAKTTRSARPMSNNPENQNIFKMGRDQSASSKVNNNDLNTLRVTGDFT